MYTALTSVLALALAVALVFGVRWLFRSLSKYRGSKIVTCPETGKPAVVEVDAVHAALTSAVGLPDIRLNHCSRWPFREQCGQECLTDLDVAPDECLVSGVLMRWYRGKQCVYCGHRFSELQWVDHKPALQNPSHELVAWKEVPIDNVRNVLETHAPVCWNCYVAQTFRLEHPDLVVLRPYRNDIPGGTGGSHVPRHP